MGPNHCICGQSINDRSRSHIGRKLLMEYIYLLANGGMLGYHWRRDRSVNYLESYGIVCDCACL